MMDSTSNSSLYGTPDGFERVAAFYDRTIDAMGEPYENFSVLIWQDNGSLFHTLIKKNLYKALV